ncbi:NAD(P)-dependent oxidoreductase [Agrobacterium pusense]|uniref:Beta-hydroxyacid dehydrogenase, 3-hydroxyisobutyrate dehydrogenase n=1 Tax=Agrobacterium pusense TaxID=648995 RepID=U4QIS2_9HYPH|nr:NAD(P)-dependent oxidoreductase [Agrobacterium pusense]CDI12341.1 Beta-hydroxyacid dehydrogenase, 3-hydroxyisobutyrate dehydrogenase [Agrobacterium pusense]
MTDNFTIGFVGLGVMGGPMCRNVALKHPGRVIAFDMNDEAFSILDGTNAERAASVAAVSAHSDFILLSLPGGPQVKAVADEVGRHGRSGATIVDLSTTPVALARQIADELSQLGLNFVDAPVARTREAAQRGELSIMVGATKDVFDKVKPILEYMATDITHGGEVGAGQVLKLVNNMLVFEHVVTLAEMIVLGERAGVKAETLLDAVSKGSGDSFVLRNHGRKAMLPRQFPERSFPPEYVLKDIDYVFQLAAETGVPLKAAETVRRYYEMAIEKGFGGQYFPGVIRLVEDGSMSEVPA